MKILALMILGLMVVGCGKLATRLDNINKEEGEKCRYCGKMFPYENIMGHQLTCTKNSVDMEFDQTSISTNSPPKPVDK